MVPGYVPGQGVAHVPGTPKPGGEGVRGLLGDQVRVSSALIWAHLATGQLPYSMLAAEVMQFAIRTMWDGTASCFRDRAEADAPLWPFALNCEAACVLDRLATMTGDACLPRPRCRDSGHAGAGVSASWNLRCAVRARHQRGCGAARTYQASIFRTWTGIWIKIEEWISFQR